MSDIDPRAFSPDKLPTTPPLPLISRKALKRVKDRVDPPTHCPYCGGPVALVNHAEIYGREYGEWPYAYRCQPCDAHVGLHRFTDIPLGSLANWELRQARKENKAHFKAVARRHRMQRNEAYAWLAEALGIPKSECHWGMFDVETARRAGVVCRQKLRRVPK